MAKHKIYKEQLQIDESGNLEIPASGSIKIGAVDIVNSSGQWTGGIAGTLTGDVIEISGAVTDITGAVTDITSATGVTGTITNANIVTNAAVLTNPPTESLDLADTLTIDTISEHTSGAGVTIDDVLLKDGTVDGLDLSSLATGFSIEGGTSSKKLTLDDNLTASTVNAHIETTEGNPHDVSKTEVGLGNVTNNAQVKKITSSTIGHVPTWSVTTGDELGTGYAVETTLVGSDNNLARADAIKTYVDNAFLSLDAMVYKGILECGVNPNYPAANAGHTYKVTIAGKIGGDLGTTVEVGDLLICNTDDSPSGNQGDVGANWDIFPVSSEGFVYGPVSSTINHIATFEGASGTSIKDSGISITKQTSSFTLSDGTRSFVIDENKSLSNKQDNITSNSITTASIVTGTTNNDKVLKSGSTSGSATWGFVQTANISDDQITYAKIQNIASDNVILGNIAGTNKVVAELTATQVRTMLNVENGAQVNVPTNLSAQTGTTAGPTITSSTGSDATIPSASASASGVVTTGAQIFAGAKTFNDTVKITGTTNTAGTLNTSTISPTSTTNRLNFNGKFYATEFYSKSTKLDKSSLIFESDQDAVLNVASKADATGKQLTISSGSATGTNIPAGNLNINTGQSTGTGTSNIIFQTANVGVSGSSVNALAERFKINNLGTNLTGDFYFNDSRDALLTISESTSTSKKNLSVRSQDAYDGNSGITNRTGGDLYLQSGKSTGTGNSSIVIQTPTPNTGANNYTHNTLNNRMTISSAEVKIEPDTTINGNVTIANDKTLSMGDMQVVDGSGNWTGGIGTLAGSVGEVSGAVTTVSGNVTTLSGAVGEVSGGVTTLSGAVTTNDGNITTNNGSITTNNGVITTNNGTIGTVATGATITTISDAVNFTNHTGTITTNNGAITTNNGTITTNDGNIGTIATGNYY